MVGNDYEMGKGTCSHMLFSTRRTFGWILLGIALGGISCLNVTSAQPQEQNKMTPKKIEEVLKEHTPEWMSVPGVVGTAQGLCGGRPCVQVYVVKKTGEIDQRIPKTIDGYPVIIEETGKIRALPKN